MAVDYDALIAEELDKAVDYDALIAEELDGVQKESDSEAVDYDALIAEGLASEQEGMDERAVAVDEERVARAMAPTAEGLLFGGSGEAAGLRALLLGGDFNEAMQQQQARLNLQRDMYPAASIVQEIVGSVPTAALGAASVPLRATEGSMLGGMIYGGLSGEGLEGRAQSMALGGGFGYLGGRLVESLSGGATAVDDMIDPQTGRFLNNEGEQATYGDIWNRMTSATDDSSSMQLSMETAKYVKTMRDAGKEVDPKELQKHLQEVGRDMGISRQVVRNNIQRNPFVRDIVRMTDEELDALTKGRLADDMAGVIPRDAQDFRVKIQQIVAPITRQFEDMVSPVVSKRINRAANLYTRAGQQVDDLFEDQAAPLRDLANANDELVDAIADATNRSLAPELRQAAAARRDEILEEADLKQQYDDFMEAQRALTKEQNVYVQTVEDTEDYLSIQYDSPRGSQTLEDAAKARDLTRSATDSDPRMKRRQRKTAKQMREEGFTPQNPFDSHYEYMRQVAFDSSMNKTLGIKAAADRAEYESLRKGEFFGNQLAKQLVSEGYSQEQARNARRLFNDLRQGHSKSMSQEFQIIRNLGYASTIGTPYGALMNMHDLFNAAFDKGVRNMVTVLFNDMGFKLSPKDMGLFRQVYGDFVRRNRFKSGEIKSGFEAVEKLRHASESLLDFSMKYSGFVKADQWTKKKIMEGGLLKNIKEVRKDSAAWRKKWAGTFDESELNQLQNSLERGQFDNALVRELAMFELSDLQPINVAAQTQVGLAYPNLRLMYMLKGFAIKQFDLMRDRVAGEWKRGNKKKAMENALRYLIISGGGYGLVQESRQLVKGELPDYSNIPTLALYQIASVGTFGAAGANQYGMELFRRDPAGALLENLLPPTGLVGGALKDVSDLASGKNLGPDEIMKTMPLISPVYRGIESALE